MECLCLARFQASLIARRGEVFWFRRSVPVDLQQSLGNSDIRRTLRTSNRRIATRRAWSLMLVVEDAFEVLRSSGLGPDARAAFAAILDHVIDDFDREGRQVGNRAKYRALSDLLPDGHPRTTRPEGSEAVLPNSARLTPQAEASRAPASLPRSLIEDDRIMDLVEQRQQESGALADTHGRGAPRANVVPREHRSPRPLRVQMRTQVGDSS